MQVQSASDPPKKLALGERAVQADGNEYNLFQLKESGRPVEPIYASEGTPLVIGPNAVFKNAPNPNAARLFQSYCFSAECQQLISTSADCARCIRRPRKARPQALQGDQDHEGGCRRRREDGDEIKARYSKLFKV
jgi:iron(III) transport system substrate-binding protein